MTSNLQTVRRLQKNVHRLSILVEVSHYIRVLSSTASLSLVLRLSAVLLLPTYLTIFQLCYCLRISPSFSCATAYLSHHFQLCYCLLISPSFSCATAYISHGSSSPATAFLSHRYFNCATAYLSHQFFKHLPIICILYIFSCFFKIYSWLILIFIITISRTWLTMNIRFAA
jgi:hypothetical protein